MSPDAMVSLRAAASLSDVALDLALMRVGILPPADLAEIRAALRHPATQICPRTNGDGHIVIEILDGDRPVAAVHNDGRVSTSIAA